MLLALGCSAIAPMDQSSGSVENSSVCQTITRNLLNTAKQVCMTPPRIKDYVRRDTREYTLIIPLTR